MTSRGADVTGKKKNRIIKKKYDKKERKKQETKKSDNFFFLSFKTKRERTFAAHGHIKNKKKSRFLFPGNNNEKYAYAQI